MKQGTPEWLAWRKEGIGASDVPVILGVSPWRTPYELWQEKTGRREGQAENFAMRRGSAMEATARAAYEAATGIAMQPAEVTHGLLYFMRASLDGITLDGSVILEVKCPGMEDHAKAVAGLIPEKYIPQVQAQLFVSGASRCDYWSFDGYRGACVAVLPDVEMQERIVAACTAFWHCVTEQTLPPLCERDERKDVAWRLAAIIYIAAKQDVDRAAENETTARAALLALAPDGAKGCGVTLSKSERAGTVQYAKALKALAPEADLSAYTGKPTTIYSVRAS